ncbi:hypothetical protein [Streptomyces sp. NPDC007905]|uniref:hypothetical protein n=1 Tax=Streptomyces sp. NPDC007905 TaxID=3364788 RepID=UPI0036F0119A
MPEPYEVSEVSSRYRRGRPERAVAAGQGDPRLRRDRHQCPQTDGDPTTTDDAYRAALTRLAVDPDFRTELDGDTEEVARRLGLTPAQVAGLRSLRIESGTHGGSAALDPRLSKSSLFFGSAAHALAHHDITADHTDHADHAVPAYGGDSGELVRTAHRVERRVRVHLRWTVRGPGRFRGTARLRIAHQRAPMEAKGSFTYACP